MYRRTLLLLLAIVLLLPSGGAGAQGATPVPLGNVLPYWDLGLQINYPTAWPAPRFITGQVFVSPPADSTQHILKQPFIAMRIVDPINELGLVKDAPLSIIAAAGATATGIAADVVEAGPATLAGLEAAAVTLTANFRASENETINLTGLVLATRMPDGRVGLLQGTAPTDQWSDFNFVTAEVVKSAVLLRPKDFPLPQFSGTKSTFPQGGVQFDLPAGWSDQPVPSADARRYHAASLQPYTDNSGYVNGISMEIGALPLNTGMSPKQAFLQFIQARSESAVTEVKVGGTLQGWELVAANPINNQVSILTAFGSKDGKMLNVLRWSVPGMLIGVTRPVYDRILSSVTLVDRSAVAGLTVPETANTTPVPPDFAVADGIPVSTTADGAFVLGSPQASLRVIEFMDFACPYCAVYAPVLRGFIRGYVKNGRAKLELRYLTYVGGEFSRTAAYAALCAGEQNNQWAMHELLFSIYRSGGAAQYTADNIVEAARAVPAIDPVTLKMCIQSGKHATVLDTTRALAVQLGVAATPTVLVGKDGTGTFQQVTVSEDLTVLLAAVEQIDQTN